MAPVPKPRDPSASGDSEEPDPILCTDSAPDAMITVAVGSEMRTYAFKGQYYWRLTKTGIEKGYPRLIREAWDGVPDNLDAVLPYEESNRIYFFKVSGFFLLYCTFRHLYIYNIHGEYE